MASPVAPCRSSLPEHVGRRQATLTCPVPSDPGHRPQGAGSNRSFASHASRHAARNLVFPPSMLALQRTPRRGVWRGLSHTKGAAPAVSDRTSPLHPDPCGQAWTGVKAGRANPPSPLARFRAKAENSKHRTTSPWHGNGSYRPSQALCHALFGHTTMSIPHSGPNTPAGERRAG